MAQRLLLVAFCALIAVCWISSVEGARKKGCIARCNNGCRNKHSSKQRMMQCLAACMNYPRNCNKCKKGDSKCYGCLSGYMLFNSKCIPCAIGCICDGNSNCLSCRNGYIKTTSGVCAVCPPGCDCDSTGKCTCQAGYIASGSYDPTNPTTTGPQCLACAANCADCTKSGPGNCDTCKSGFLSTPVAGICQACAPNCADCTTHGAGSCDTCSSGFLVTVNGATRTCSACPAHCSSCSFGTSYCDTCMDGYGLSSDRTRCIACSGNCTSCHMEGYNKCDPAQCGTGLTYSSSSPSCGTANCISGCDVCYTTPATVCDICTASKAWDTSSNPGACTAVITKTACTTFNQYCLYCGLGASATACVKCDDTKKTDSTCSAAPTACTGTAATANPNCKHCSGSVCTECKKGYHTNADGSCTPCAVAHCDVCEASASKCQSCSGTLNLHVNGLLCSACDPACGTADCATNNQCDTYCIDGYALNNGACQPCAPGCKSCYINGAGSCDDQQCKTGFNIDANNKCVKA